MRAFTFLQSLSCLLLCALLSNVATASSSAAAALSPKAQKLAKLSQSSKTGVVRLNAATFDEFVTSSPSRDYSLSVTFNAINPQQGCAPCAAFQKELDLLATQWTRKRPDQKQKGTTPHFFALVEFTEAQQLFMRLGLQTAPVTRWYGPTSGPEASLSKSNEEYDIRMGLSAASLARWVLVHKPGISFTYSPPVDYTFSISVAVLLSMASYVTYQKSDLIWPFLSGRYLWAAVCLLFIVTMNSGYMWTQIRHPPYMTPQGGLIAQGHQNQFGVEVHLLAALYSLLGISVSVLVFSLPKVADPVAQRVGIYVWIFIYASLHALLVSLFKSKNPSYPFSFILW